MLAIGLLLAGMGAGRLTAPSNTRERPVATAATSVPAPVSSDDSTARTTGDRTEGGAVAAALELAAAPQTWLYLGDAALEAAVRRVATSEASDRLVDEVVGEVGVVRDALARSPGRVWWVVRPLATRVDSYTSDRAQVSVWTVTILSAADVAMPQSDWFITLLDLRWETGAWRLAATSESAGPTPQLGGRDEVWEPEPFDETLAGFERVGAEAAR
jgi:hypothetical protein